jgi:predicted porin
VNRYRIVARPALVVGALLALAGAAGAQSSITAYGRIDLGLVVDSGVGGKTVRLSSGVAKGSQLGFKGTEDLGGGYKSAFLIETGYCADSAIAGGLTPGGPGGETVGSPNFCSGSNNFMGRQARLELAGPFGAVSAGRQFALGYITMLRTDPFLGTAGQMNNIIDPSGFRLNNSVRYATPVVAGFGASVDVAFGEVTGNWKGSRETGGSLDYDLGDAHAHAIYYKVDNANGVGTAKQNIMLAGTYDFGFVRLHGLAQKTTGAPTGKARLNTLAYMLGVSVPIGAGRLQASYVEGDDRTAANKDANQIAIGYLYYLSKSVSMYTAWGRIRNEHGALFYDGNATDAGAGNRSFNLGMACDF